VDVYAPLVYGFARKRGLQDADAADLTQEVLRAVAGAAERLDYDPQKGSFRGWLFTVARNKLLNFLAQQRRLVQGAGDTSAQDLLEAQPAGEEDEAALWDKDYERRIFAWVAERVRGGFQDSTWLAFWQTAVDGRSAKAVAESLGMTVGAVYIAKSRVLARLKEQIQELQAE
jgi:RNA polymerase sigma-70 factor (ECF subfamily)